MLSLLCQHAQARVKDMRKQVKARYTSSHRRREKRGAEARGVRVGLGEGSGGRASGLLNTRQHGQALTHTHTPIQPPARTNAPRETDADRVRQLHAQTHRGQRVKNRSRKKTKRNASDPQIGRAHV